MKQSPVAARELHEFFLNCCPDVHQNCLTSDCPYFRDMQCQHPENPYNREPETIEEWPYEH